MDLTNIKRFIVSRGDRLIFMQDGEPEMVLMSFNEYARLVGFRAPGDKPAPYADESFDIPSGRDGSESRDSLETELIVQEFQSPAPEIGINPVGNEAGRGVGTADALAHRVSKGADHIRLEDLPL